MGCLEAYGLPSRFRRLARIADVNCFTDDARLAASRNCPHLVAANPVKATYYVKPFAAGLYSL